MRGVITDMLKSPPDVFVAWTNLALATLQPMVVDLPVVFVGIGDPVGSGFVASLAHPGTNMTGFGSYDEPMGGKWLEMLKETAPHVTRVMILLTRRHCAPVVPSPTDSQGGRRGTDGRSPPLASRDGS